jgi:hypothetical protein
MVDIDGDNAITLDELRQCIEETISLVGMVRSPDSPPSMSSITACFFHMGFESQQCIEHGMCKLQVSRGESVESDRRLRSNLKSLADHVLGQRVRHVAPRPSVQSE